MIEPEFEANLVKLIGSKITGEARQSIFGQSFAKIEELKNFLKKIYSLAKSIPQLLGELGNEFQRDRESVIAFANRVREIGIRILEVKKLEDGGRLDPILRASIDKTIVDSFRRGLKLEIEQRLPQLENEAVGDLVQNAITIERRLEAQRNLRKKVIPRFENLNLRPKRTFACQICNKSNYETAYSKSKLWCQFGKINGHSLENCFKAKINIQQIKRHARLVKNKDTLQPFVTA